MFVVIAEVKAGQKAKPARHGVGAGVVVVGKGVEVAVWEICAEIK